MKTGRITRWLGIAALLCAVSGYCAQSALAPKPAPRSTNNNIEKSLKEFSDVLGVVQANYADPVSPDIGIYGPSGSNNLGAIPGMLRILDPHSNFFDPESFAKMQEEMRGNYFGVGMAIAPLPGKSGRMVTVVEQPLPNSPAFNAGLRPGDVIAEIDGKPTAGEDTTQIMHLLRGPANTSVTIGVTREGVSHMLHFTLERQKITQPSVDAAFMLKPGIAYIHINTFNETTDPELAQALNSLDRNSLKGLVLDLRGNRGGLLQQAVGVASHFLRKNQLIVYHNGRNSPEQRYYAVTGEQGPEYPIVVLINDNTASAAEIVTGALQDHDRALVMGQRSFGKGLVQTEFPLSDNTMLLLTTAHYYTPSGRLIQREYSRISLYDYYNHYDPEPLPHTQARLTDGGRTVYGGGGIAPDVAVPPRKLSLAERQLLASNAFFDFGRHYLATHQSIPANFKTSNKVLDEFRKFLATQDVTLPDGGFEASEQFIRQQIQEQLVRSIYGTPAADKIRVEDDPLVAQAIASMPQAEALLVQAQRYMASRGTE